MLRSTLAVTGVLVLLSACDTTRNADNIVGGWQGSEWLIDGKTSANDARAASFQFAADGNYTYTYAGTREQGLYKIYEDKLYTTPAGGQEMMVRILKLTKDSLVFDMNRAGQPETLTLLRK